MHTKRQHYEELKSIWNEIERIAFELSGDSKIYKIGADPRDFNVLWRSYIISLNEKHKTSIDKLKQENEIERPSRNSSSFDLGGKEDEELSLFNEMPLEEKIMKVNVFLRTEFYYCYFCNLKYTSEKELFQNCPGIRKIDHE
ncbi:Cmg1p NDAI_0I02220 [Naumovozyma dairenensis CBS 421]|uniref:DUF4187 domain-containing protein n=1 Tax=Naumovozyma dairenensis (strain ATCC 10597 / BCRC 20456 / CBS 421 / NBRC 0211 / NRRL Y-12639) TaxID=1071378 RepID=G0WG80_NAUDC|nr:hypothetical protein NDAI_0I02220 [Naumovozyma dairenensis CBS 421]CCD26791.1 hypothetical protein NDAI_0I02220 [Naumovozyma dairenensis CBS 421]